MNGTTFLPACFDLDEGLPIVIIHNLFCFYVCKGLFCVAQGLLYTALSWDTHIHTHRVVETKGPFDWPVSTLLTLRGSWFQKNTGTVCHLTNPSFKAFRLLEMVWPFRIRWERGGCYRCGGFVPKEESNDGSFIWHTINKIRTGFLASWYPLIYLRRFLSTVLAIGIDGVQDRHLLKKHGPITCHFLFYSYRLPEIKLWNYPFCKINNAGFPVL